MKNSTFLGVSAILVSILAVSQSGLINEPLDQIESYSFVDDIIKSVLNNLKPRLANLKFDDINENVSSPELNASVVIKDISINNVDQFEIQNLKSSLIPLSLKNLTLNWKDIIANADYDICVNISVPKIKDPFIIFGKGNAKAILEELHFTTGANLELKDKKIQVKHRGLFGFDVKIGRANVTLTSLMGSSEFGDAVGKFISQLIPSLVDNLKKSLFDAFQDDIIRVVNQFLRNEKNLFVDEEELAALSQFSEPFLKNLNLIEEMGSFFKQNFDSGMQEYEKTEELKELKETEETEELKELKETEETEELKELKETEETEEDEFKSEPEFRQL